jgi:hypothetical protein
MLMRPSRIVAMTMVAVAGATSCGEDAPVSLDASDRVEILAAVAAERVKIFQEQITLVDVVEVVGRGVDGFVRFAEIAPLTDAERDAIIAAVAPAAVEFVRHDHVDAARLDLSHVAIQLAEPEIVDGRVMVTSAILCGELCATGGPYSLDTNDDGAWMVTGAPLENQWAT